MINGSGHGVGGPSSSDRIGELALVGDMEGVAMEDDRGTVRAAPEARSAVTGSWYRAWRRDELADGPTYRRHASRENRLLAIGVTSAIAAFILASVLV